MIFYRQKFDTASACWGVLQSLLGGLLVLIAVLQTVHIIQTWREYRHLQDYHRTLYTQLKGMQREMRENQAYLECLKTNPAFIERVIRQELHYVRENETLLRFKGTSGN